MRVDGVATAGAGGLKRARDQAVGVSGQAQGVGCTGGEDLHQARGRLLGAQREQRRVLERGVGSQRAAASGAVVARLPVDDHDVTGAARPRRARVDLRFLDGEAVRRQKGPHRLARLLSSHHQCQHVGMKA